jgi:phosphatidylinositol glycan class T
MMMAVKAAAAEEEFREELTLRPLPDGKVAAHFSFSTLLRGAVPRAPSNLGTDDTCNVPAPPYTSISLD